MLVSDTPYRINDYDHRVIHMARSGWDLVMNLVTSGKSISRVDISWSESYDSPFEGIELYVEENKEDRVYAVALDKKHIPMSINGREGILNMARSVVDTIREEDGETHFLLQCLLGKARIAQFDHVPHNDEDYQDKAIRYS